MPTLSGIYTSASGKTLSTNQHGELILTLVGERQEKLRTDSEFWLCVDDGMIGKFGHPEKVRFCHRGEEYHVWVEARGFNNGRCEYGLVVIPPGGEYSNRFLAVNAQGELYIQDSWTKQAMFWCIE